MVCTENAYVGPYVGSNIHRKKFLVDFNIFQLLSVVRKSPKDTYLVECIVEHAIQLILKIGCFNQVFMSI